MNGMLGTWRAHKKTMKISHTSLPYPNSFLKPLPLTHTTNTCTHIQSFIILKSSISWQNAFSFFLSFLPPFALCLLWPSKRPEVLLSLVSFIRRVLSAWSIFACLADNSLIPRAVKASRTTLESRCFLSSVETSDSNTFAARNSRSYCELIEVWGSSKETRR